MKAEHRRQYIAGGIFLLAVAILVTMVYTMISVTSREDVYLMDTATKRYGWSYELLVDGEPRTYEPTFENANYPSLPEGTQAVRIRRTMTEELASPQLEWECFFTGVEVSFNGRLLHSDFQGTERDASGFLRGTQAELKQIWGEDRENSTWRKVRISLPRDYLGGELSMTTYFPEDWGNALPEYPFLGGDDLATPSVMTRAVISAAAMTLCALMALLLAAVYLLDIPNGRADGRTLLLCLYYLLLFLDEAYNSDAGYYSILSGRASVSLLSALYIAPLYLYLALQLTQRWKYLLCGGVIGWGLYEGTRMLLNMLHGLDANAGRSGMGAFVLFLAVAAAMAIERLSSGKRRSRGEHAAYLLMAVAVAAICIFNNGHGWSSLGRYLTHGVFGTLREGNFQPAVHLIANFCSVLATIALIVSFIHRTLRSREAVTALQERSRLTLESYNRLLEAEEATNAVRHEMRHHMTALSGILDGGDTERARRYVSSVTSELDQLPMGRYSYNVLVNVIAGAYLDRARAEGIEVEHRLSVPTELGIADEDLSVLLTNMLQNALQACERLEEGKRQYIRVQMQANENFLFVKCVNSAPEAEEGEENGERVRDGHGYGLAAMRRIAEKYGSILVIEHADGEYCVRSNLNLRRQAPYKGDS